MLFPRQLHLTYPISSPSGVDLIATTRCFPRSPNDEASCATTSALSTTMSMRLFACRLMLISSSSKSMISGAYRAFIGKASPADSTFAFSAGLATDDTTGESGRSSRPPYPKLPLTMLHMPKCDSVSIGHGERSVMGPDLVRGRRCHSARGDGHRKLDGFSLSDGDTKTVMTL